jgi:hypothetical protein
MAKAGPFCGAQRRGGKGPCGLDAGAGTDHKGYGRCSWHGGASPAGGKAAAEQMAEKAVATYGLPRDISPTDALLEEVRFTAGHVAWLRQRVSELAPDALTWGTREVVDKQATEFTGTDTTEAAAVNVWLELYYRERKHLLDVCKAAISVGIEERYVRLEEAKGQLVADLIRRILGRLDLSDLQQDVSARVIPEEFRRAIASLN